MKGFIVKYTLSLSHSQSNNIFLVICSEVVVFVVAKIFLQLIPLRTLLRVMLLEVTMATAIMN